MKSRSVEELIAGHQLRDSSLRRVFSDRKVDMRQPRTVECHFWAWSQEDTIELAEALKIRGFKISVQRPASISEDPSRWNLEATIQQSIDLTMRREFVEDLVRLAQSHNGVYDGWGTSI